MHPNFIVGIGGSAGSLPAYTAFLDALPSTTGMAFVVVAHMLPTANSLLAELLASHTDMPLKVASAAMPIRANHVYVNPPNTDLRVDDYSFDVVSPRTVSNKQVDLFFVSLAEAMGTRAIGIVFSGYDGDGTEGCRHIKARGGKTIAQDASAKVSFMPLTAQASGLIDLVLAPGKIPAALQRMAARSAQGIGAVRA